MKRAHRVLVRACSRPTGRSGPWTVGLAVAGVMLAPMPMWGQWNGTNPIWTNSYVGIGTPNPAYKFDVQGNIRANYGQIYVTNSPTTASRVMLFGGTDGGNTSGVYVVNANGNYSTYLGDGTYNSFLNTQGGNVGIGTFYPQYKLAVNGTIGAREVIVTNSGWYDHVFRPGYRLRPLREVGAYIRAHRHLPDIPSEAEVKEKGISLGEMQAKLLAKIEELTLHMIQQDQEHRELRERLAQLETRAAVR